MILEQGDYRAYLRSVYSERHGRNPSYSLRAMARQIGCAPSTLSEIMSGKKRLSPTKALSTALKLGLQSSEAEYFQLLVQADGARDPALRRYVTERMEELRPRDGRQLTLDNFRLISDWYHLPALELSRQGVTAAVVAQRLGITSIEAATALERLERLELVTKEAAGRYRRVPGNVQTSSQIPSEALRSYHRQMLTRATESLETQTPQEKVVGSETFAFDPALLEEARRITDQYLNEIGALSKKSKNPSEVYHVGAQFFRITKKEKSK